MPVRMKAKTTPTGYIAEISRAEGVGEFPVARFDDDGYALVAHPKTGRLERAIDLEGFTSVIPMWQASR